MSRIETRWIDDPDISDAERGKHVQFWADTQTTGGYGMASMSNHPGQSAGIQRSWGVIGA
jgi:hypothetical protein